MRVKENFEMILLEEMDQYSQRLGRDRRGHMESSQRFAILRCYCHLIDQINTFSQTLGKDGKFQLFVCLSARYLHIFIFTNIFYQVKGMNSSKKYIRI